MYETWERYKELLRKCPNYEIPKWLQLKIFYNSLQSNIQVMVDMTSRGAINNMTLEVAYDLMKTLASNDYVKNERNQLKKAPRVFEVDHCSTLVAQMLALQQQINQLNIKTNVVNTSVKICEFCRGKHVSEDCQVGNLLRKLNKLIT